jgi:hypothetical protein
MLTGSWMRVDAIPIGREKKTMVGYWPRKLAANDYGTQLLHVDVQGCATVKVEVLSSVAVIQTATKAKSIVGPSTNSPILLATAIVHVIVKRKV